MNNDAVRLDRNKKEEELRNLIPDLEQKPIDSKLFSPKADTKIDWIKNEASELNNETIELNTTAERAVEELRAYSPQRDNGLEQKLFESKSLPTNTEAALS